MLTSLPLSHEGAEQMWRRERVIEGVSARAAIELHTALSDAVAAHRAAGRERARTMGNRGVAVRDAAAQETPPLMPEECAVRARLEAKARLYDAAADAGHSNSSSSEDACLDFGAMKRVRTSAAKPAADREFIFAEPEKTGASSREEEEEEEKKGQKRDAHAVEDVIVEITEEDAATREAKRARHAAALDAVLSENSARAQQDAAQREARRARDAARIAHIRALQAAARRQQQPG